MDGGDVSRSSTEEDESIHMKQYRGDFFIYFFIFFILLKRPDSLTSPRGKIRKPSYNK
jgi:hypothetical protein